jgi:peptidoglycan/xylan/chitin deacetylase (PgdA/CDA1 family)
LTSPKKRYAAFIRTREVLKSHEDRREDILKRLADDSAPLGGGPEECRVVDADMLHRLVGPNFTVGAHSRSHRILAGLPLAHAEEEIHGSRRDLEAILNRSVVDFAYPNGRFCDFNLPTRDLLVKIGFRCAVTAEPGTVRLDDDRFALRRFMPDDLPVFLASFDLLRSVWNDRNRPGDMGCPLGKRLSHLAPPRAVAETSRSQRTFHHLGVLKDRSVARRE